MRPVGSSADDDQTLLDTTDANTQSSPCARVSEHQQKVDKAQDVIDRQIEDQLDFEKNGGGSNSDNSDSLPPRENEKGDQEKEAIVGDVIEIKDVIHTQVNKNVEDADVIDTSTSPSSPLRDQDAHQEDGVATRDDTEGQQRDKDVDGSIRDGVQTVADNEPEVYSTSPSF